MSELLSTIEDMDEWAVMWGDPEWSAARVLELDHIDERDLLDVDAADVRPSPAECHDAAVTELETVAVEARIAMAHQYRVIAEVLRDAAEAPGPWVGPDPTLDPGWMDPRDRTVARVRRERREVAVRAAAADIAVRLRLSETTVRTRAAHADTLRERCPRVWRGFVSGRVSEQNAKTAAQLAESLPEDAAETWAAFDERAVGRAAALAPGAFRTSARAIRERVHAESIERRHRRAAADRGVWLTPELDGLATVTALLPATRAHEAYGQVDATARRLAAADGEERSLAQLRADVFSDLLANGADGTAAAPSGGAPAVDVDTASRAGAAAGAAASAPPPTTVAITIPALTLLGHDDEPAILEGYGPIDIDTARALAGGATSWVRVLTHPVTSTVLDVDRRSYRVPADLRRLLVARHPTCVFPGCIRRARDCDLDHTVAWQHGGVTSADNIAPVCRPHHRLKHESEWGVRRDVGTGGISWTSPTGHTSDADPPPF